MAMAAGCAAKQGRFWEFHDAVFGDAGRVRPERLEHYASRAGLDATAFDACVAGRDSADGLDAGIALARAHAVTATPTFFFNGRRVVGALKPWMLEAAIGALVETPRGTAGAGP